MSRSKAKAVIPETHKETSGGKPKTAKELVASLRETGLIGMWKNRGDIDDGGKFTSRLRKQASRRKVTNGASARH